MLLRLYFRAESKGFKTELMKAEATLPIFPPQFMPDEYAFGCLRNRSKRTPLSTEKPV